jgi:hypothetical protein
MSSDQFNAAAAHALSSPSKPKTPATIDGLPLHQILEFMWEEIHYLGNMPGITLSDCAAGRDRLLSLCGRAEKHLPLLPEPASNHVAFGLVRVRKTMRTPGPLADDPVHGPQGYAGITSSRFRALEMELDEFAGSLLCLAEDIEVLWTRGIGRTAETNDGDCWTVAEVTRDFNVTGSTVTTWCNSDEGKAAGCWQGTDKNKSWHIPKSARLKWNAREKAPAVNGRGLTREIFWVGQECQHTIKSRTAPTCCSKCGKVGPFTARRD